MRNRFKWCTPLLCAGLLILSGMEQLSAQTLTNTDIPISRVALFSSGVGFFEHTAKINGSVITNLPFDLSAVNDVLKSLVINDPLSTAPSVTYSSEDTLERTLKSLKIDLSGKPGVAEILDSLRGAEIQVFTPQLITGRIVGVEKRQGGENIIPQSYLTLFTKDGIRVVGLSEVSSFAFTDRKLTEDLNRALDLILSSKDTQNRTLQVHLPGKGERAVTLGYVIAAPVWKASYRLDLSSEKSFLQGWAIIDNAGDMDWNNVELSLVTGRPVSFIQDLYPPFFLSRPVLPLAIAGIAEAETYDSGYDKKYAEEALAEYASAPVQSAPRMAKAMMNDSDEKQKPLGSGNLETTLARSAGDLFEFTVKKPVTLSRQQSAMIPLIEASIKAEKVSVFSGYKASSGSSVHPMLCAQLTNSTGMKLPAGPITVFDGGTYQGDALVEFFPENDTRLIAFGEDLSVTGSVTGSSAQETTGVVVNKGVMSITRRYTYSKKYTFRNASTTARKMVLEHPVLQGSTLSIPAKYDEKTDSVYRFSLLVPANAEVQYEVVEQTPVQETVSLTQLRLDAFVYYSNSVEMPAKIKASLEKAIEFKKKTDSAKTALSVLETKKEEKINEQDRIRMNLEAAGNTSSQGKEYLKKLTEADSTIDSLSAQIDAARKIVQETQSAYETYLSSLTLE